MRTYQTMTDKEILRRVLEGAYRVDIDEGRVYLPSGREATYMYKRNRKFVRICDGRAKRRAIAVARLVWMVATRSTIPRGFEVHHEDESRENDAYFNLTCLHTLDHRKRHTQPEGVPF